MTEVEISVIIPTYNRKSLLKKTLESLLNQTYPKDKYEILVCDDGSTDGTGDVVNEFIRTIHCNIRYLSRENKGPAATRNLGIKNAGGDIIVFIDDDAIADRNWIKEHLRIYDLEEIEINDIVIPQNKIAGVGGRIKMGNPENKIAIYCEYGRYKMFDRETSKELSFSPPHGHPTCNMSFKKKIFDEVGMFDEKFKYPVGEDTDLGIRITDEGYVFIYNPNVLVYHKHPESIIGLIKKWYNIGKYEVLLAKEDSRNEIISPFRLPSRKFLIKYWYLIPIDVLVRISIILGIIKGHLSKKI